MDNKIPKISSLQNEKEERNLILNNVYQNVLNKCIEKIIQANRHTDQTFIIFQVPKIMIGEPRYNIKACIYYIIKELQKHDYLIHYIDPYYIYIDWGSYKNSRIESTNKELKKYFPNVKNIEYVYNEVMTKKTR